MTCGLNKLTFLVFGRNCGIDFQKTIDTVEQVVQLYPNIKFQLVIVDDGSNDNPQKIVNEKLFFSVDQIFLPLSLGINGAINAGVAYVKFERMIWLPASNMYGVTAICNLIDNSKNVDLVIGFRSNLTTARPFVKLISSLMVRGIMQLFTFHFISDFKGCNLYHTKDVREWLSPTGLHGGDLVLLTQILLRTTRIVQVPTPINELHNHRQSKKISDNWPSRKAVWSAVKGIITSVVLYRSTNKN